MLAAAIISWKTTPRPIHEANDFNFEPVREVAWLFIGIFLTMMPALDLLAAGELPEAFLAATILLRLRITLRLPG